jgi:hypothetical protein
MTVTCKLLFGKLHSSCVIEIFRHCRRTSFRITNWRRQYRFLRKAFWLLSDTAASQQRREYSSGSSKLWQETDYFKCARNYEYIWRPQVATAQHYPGQVLCTQNFPNFKYLQYVDVLCYINPQSTLKDLHEVKDSARSQRGPNSKHGSFRCLWFHQQLVNTGVFKPDRRFHLLQVNKRHSMLWQL